MDKTSQENTLYSVIKKTTDVSFFIKVIFFIAFVFIVYINIINAKQPILEAHAFRQTQTALTSYYLKLNGFSFDYQTPVMGEPWSIPFEFPIYQQLVATISAIIGSSLTETGRLLSLFFVLLTCIPIYFTLNRLAIDRNAIYFSLALYLSSPIYLFWAGTFLIEGAALFFTCSFLYYATKILQRDWTNKNFIFCSLFLTLALLQKITTVLPSLCVISLIFAMFTVRRNDLHEHLSLLFKLVIGVFLSVLIGYCWLKFSDSVKVDNPIGAFFISSNQTRWNFGFLGQRLSEKFWFDVIFDRNIKKSSFFLFGLAFIFMAFFLVKEKLTKSVIIISFLLFLLPFLIFSNLHIIHNYYQISNSVFLSIAVGISVVYICNLFLKNKPIIYGLVLLSFLLSNFYFFYKDYFPKKIQKITNENNRILMLSDFIKNHTSQERPVIWYGFDWSSAPAFYSERKSLTVPSPLSIPNSNFEIDAIEKTEKFLKTQPSAIVLCPPEDNYYSFALVKAAMTKKYGSIDPKIISDCEVYILENTK